VRRFTDGIEQTDEISSPISKNERRNARSHYSKWDYARGKSRNWTIDTIQELWQELSSPANCYGEVVGDSKKRAGFMKN
jgi:hypothetical protein